MTTTDKSRADALTDERHTWTDDDRDSLLGVIDALERIESGMTQTNSDHLFAKTRPRKMTITDAKVLASTNRPFLRRLFERLEGHGSGSPFASPVEQHEAAPADLSAGQRQAILHTCRLYLDDESGKYNARSVLTRIFSLAAEAPAAQPEPPAPAAVGKIETFSGKHGLTWTVDPETLPVGTLIYSGAQPEPPAADERAAKMAHDLRCAGVAGTKVGDLLHSAAAMLEELAARASSPTVPADERTALSEDRIDWIANAHCPSGTAYPVNVKNAIREALNEARASSPNAAGAEGATFQTRVQPWMLECFGVETSADRVERNHRFLEEALELVQACGCTASEAHQLVDYTFGRPLGEPAQEVGGVMVTLAGLCLANDLDMHAAGETELARVWTKVEQIRAKHAAKPRHSPLPGPSATEHCQCPACRTGVIHASDCAVHNAPALPRGACDCGAGLPDSEGGEM
ncbi:hypothetical protein [Burkholderia cenocepacia]|uniref:hypothetical protein n=1 Tax=Burkholderia cenocepacia TaxID=95486 RepID=UPI002012C9BB|nr:hypothetical protein [Burkholderia cenocepacia]